MYAVDGADRVVELQDLPQASVGAPCPVVLAGEHHLSVGYSLEDVPPGWDGTTVRVVGPGTAGEPSVVVRFARAHASMFGPPNDEAFSGHPLARRGLKPYGAFEILSSSWIRALERMNSVHPYHKPEHFSKYRHFILSFHDTTFECVATAYECELAKGAMAELIAQECRGSREEGHERDGYELW